MSQRSTLIHSCAEPEDYYSSGEESESSYFSACEDQCGDSLFRDTSGSSSQDLDLASSDSSENSSRVESFPVSDPASSNTSGKSSIEEIFWVIIDPTSTSSDSSANLSEENLGLDVSGSHSCSEHCRIDIDTQTSNCQICNRLISAKKERPAIHDLESRLERKIFLVTDPGSTSSDSSSNSSEDNLGFAVSESHSCTEHCRIDIDTQTSNCQFCNRLISAKRERECSESSSSEDSISYKGGRPISSFSSLTTVTPPILESDIESDELYSTILEHLVYPTISDYETENYAEYLVSETFETIMPNTPDKSADGDDRFADRSINSVARIIVADTVEAVRMDKPSETEEVFHDASSEDILWRKVSFDSQEKMDSTRRPDSNRKSSHNFTAEEKRCQEIMQSANTPAKGSCSRMVPGDTNEPTYPTLVEHAIWTVENLHEMWSQGVLCDALLATSSGKEFSAHQVILGLHSEFFRDILSSSSASSEDCKGYLKIHLRDSIRDKTLENILRFMYTSLVQINTDTISDLLHASIQLSIHRLTRLCMTYIDHVTVDNCFMVLAIAEKNRLSNHINRTKTFIYNNFMTVSKTETFLNSSIELVADILTEDVLNVDSEVDVFLAAKRWSQRNQDADMKSAAAVMKTIRFELFSAEEIAKHVEAVEWLMEIPEVRVQVLEAYRYLSLAASGEEKLRPPAPTCRRSVSKVHVSKVQSRVRSRRDVSTAMSRSEGLHVCQNDHSNLPKRDVSTATSRSGRLHVGQNDHIPSIKRDVPAAMSRSGRLHVGQNDHIPPKRDVSAVISSTGGVEVHREVREEDHTHHSRQKDDISPAVSGIFFSPSSFASGKGRKMKKEKEASALMLREPAKRSSSKSLRKQRTDSRSRHGEATKIKKEPCVADAFMDSPHLRDAMMGNETSNELEQSPASKTTVVSMPGKIAHRASKISPKTSDESLNFPGLKKPLSDYRITTANPKALTHGPQAWPQRKNIVPSCAEDDLSDIIIVSGGVSAKGDVDNPGKMIEVFDPLVSQWRESIETPVARNHHVVAFLQDSIYLIGGSDPHSEGSEFIKPVKTVFRYDLRLNKWTETSSMSCARIFHQASALLGQLYVVGGQDHHGRALSSVETYAPVSDSWRKVTPISTPRYAVAMTTYGQRLWVAGGYCQEAGSQMVDTVECFNPYSEEWKSIKTLRSARCHANLLVASGHLYLVGGYMVGYHGVDKHSTIDVYDEDEKRWRHVADMEHGRHDGKTVACHDKIYVFGARSDDDQERPLSRVDYFDTTDSKWNQRATDLTSARFGHACCIVPAPSAANWM